MKLWYISQTVNNNYDTYDSAVVAAETAAEAQMIQPSGFKTWNDPYFHNDWCDKPEQVKVRLIGEAVRGTKPGVILASFNAG